MRSPTRWSVVRLDSLEDRHVPCAIYYPDFWPSSPAGAVRQLDEPSWAAFGTFDPGATAVPPTPDAAVAGSIAGQVFRDTNGNGARDPGEPGRRGVVVYLDANDNGRRNRGEPRRVTDALGAYAFTDLQPGTYHVREVVPRGRVQTTANSYTVDLAGGQVVTGADFGHVRPGRLAVPAPPWLSSAGPTLVVSDPTEPAADGGWVTTSTLTAPPAPVWLAPVPATDGSSGPAVWIGPSTVNWSGDTFPVDAWAAGLR